MLHVFVPGYTLLSFIKNVEKQDLNAYESVSKTQFHHYTTYSDFNKLSNLTDSIAGHRRVFMDATDMVKFLYTHDRSRHHRFCSRIDTMSRESRKGDR